ncbi:hypothetical protein [Candidatus Jettenia sp. AMX1]|uniref:hypothetical protein n=1 Tax=Candidatus Jettenia sp. AMX1 TaxID=2293637 RepID=UPI0025552BE1|nr:hypothetical protein [Candidatus Jettenia sp. AMX1]MDL1937592.1 hypothetical protein [Candidatus Jettenia sp. AMX1]WKZ17082.1 MAG: hypothetical protein QY317_07130 [Candidatus Jettenia caeni]
MVRTNGFVRAYLPTYMDMDYKTLTNKVCQCHPGNRLTSLYNHDIPTGLSKVETQHLTSPKSCVCTIATSCVSALNVEKFSIP